ncbi:SRPBCC family protein [Aurantimonas sp. 22II-16-19i]|uniref:SRPBCC family protein n=1 Tax=Aurantimonas sp. 22II-16-19i TaxID=1317114 RepID=UPI0009F7E093|nr:SRPBCC family protein [Aurantimonas sp. 22II-16-19i]ORE95176.1 MxaD protein [Aurantimonas sp. 22II-16-19i]
MKPFRRTLLCGLAAACLVPFVVIPASAHGPTPQKTDETVVIDAPFDAVWTVVEDFGSIAKWHPAVRAVRLGDDGKTRTVTLEGGDIVESLDAVSKERGVVAWRMDEPNPDALAVSSFNDKLRITATDDTQTSVQWIGRFYRADTSNFPAEGQTDVAAVAAMADHVTTGLEGLKRYVEGKGAK